MSDHSLAQPSWEYQLLHLYRRILVEGERRADRTGTGTFALFGERLDIDLKQGFPLVTTKNVPFRLVASELLWFLEGSGDERRLADILHGSRSPEHKTIWSANADATTGASFKPNFAGDLGRVYGVQWRHWRQYTRAAIVIDNQYVDPDLGFYRVSEIDQVAQLMAKLHDNPTDRRHLLTALNIAEFGDMALPPCHLFAQFYVTNQRDLSCQLVIRSSDTFLGLPFNVASYALLTHMMACVLHLNVGRLIVVTGDTHIYKDHVDAVKVQLDRTPYSPPRLLIRDESSIKSIDDFGMKNFEIADYLHDDAISAKMSA
jgi:thymidylate synthase